MVEAILKDVMSSVRNRIAVIQPIIDDYQMVMEHQTEFDVVVEEFRKALLIISDFECYVTLNSTNPLALLRGMLLLETFTPLATNDYITVNQFEGDGGLPLLRNSATLFDGRSEVSLDEFQLAVDDIVSKIDKHPSIPLKLVEYTIRKGEYEAGGDIFSAVAQLALDKYLATTQQAESTTPDNAESTTPDNEESLPQRLCGLIIEYIDDCIEKLVRGTDEKARRDFTNLIFYALGYNDGTYYVNVAFTIYRLRMYKDIFQRMINGEVIDGFPVVDSVHVKNKYINHIAMLYME